MWTTLAKRSLHNQSTVCGTHTHGCLIDGLLFQLLTSLKLVLSDGLKGRLKASILTKLKP